jgi:hypothetical protein
MINSMIASLLAASCFWTLLSVDLIRHEDVLDLVRYCILKENFVDNPNRLTEGPHLKRDTESSAYR